MRAFIHFLECLYPDYFVELSPELVLEVFPLAHKFDVPALQAQCIAWVKGQPEFARLDVFGQSSPSLDAAVLIDSLVGPMSEWDDSVHARMLKGIMGDGGLFEINVDHITRLQPETLKRMLGCCLADKAALAACFGLQRLRDVPRGVEWYAAPPVAEQSQARVALAVAPAPRSWSCALRADQRAAYSPVGR
jgi:hypothetical protein